MEEKFSHAEGPEAGRNFPFQTKEDLSKSVRTKAFDLTLAEHKHTFCREEKLKSRKLIEKLFKEGKSVSKGGFTLFYLPVPLLVSYPAQAAFSVPKRNFKLAVDRNRVKRLMREVYRTRKFPLYKQLILAHTQLALMWVFKGREVPEYGAAESAMLDCLQQLLRKVR